MDRDQSAAQAQQIMGLSEQLRLAQQDCSAAHQRLHAKDGDLRELQAQHAELQQASRALQAELAAARDRLGVLEADLPMLQQDVLQLSSENTTLHIELEGLPGSCEAAAGAAGCHPAGSSAGQPGEQAPDQEPGCWQGRA